MKVAIIHISDFHVKADEHFINEKISRFLCSLNALGTIDEYAIVFSGDLAYSGQINEYRSSRYVIGQIINGVKQKNNEKFVEVLIVPGNHDLTLTKESRDRVYIQQHYDDNCIESIVADEINMLKNFYAYSHANSQVPYDRIINRRFCSYGDYRIQFNLINTSLFSTLEPDDKELHYFPQEKMQYLKKTDFEDQYGDNPILLERYQQAEKRKKVLVVDGWEQLSNSRNREQLLQMIEEDFEYIILSANNAQQSIIESIKDEINKKQSFQELQIKPFFAEKRSQLVRNICLLNSPYNDEDIEKVNRLIDSLVQNNSNLFSLNPGFIIRYTDYFIKDHYYDYTRGEAIFSKVFEYELQRSIMEFTKRTDVDEFITVFEEIAGYMYKSRNDILRIEDVRKVIEGYNAEYGIKVNPTLVLEIGKRSKLFKEMDDLSIYFANKNYLAYFIAKYLLRIAQNDDPDYSGIQYALKNICFGINSDIILFISYLSRNTKTVMSIAAQAGDLLSPWEEIDFSKNNISYLRKCKLSQIEAPVKEDHDRMKKCQENAEEARYNNTTIEAKGLFQYDESDIDEYPYRLIRAINYTEMICKALPAFNSSLKLPQKEQIIESIYSYPHKIAFAMLKPIDEKIEMLCDELLAFAQKNNFEKKAGVPYSKDDILDLFVSYSNAMILSIYDHFSELCTSPKTIDLLSAKSYTETNKRLQRLMIIENSGNTEVFMREAEGIIRTSKDEAYNYMVRLVVRKHLLYNPELPFNKRQQIVDKFFGKEARKEMLLSSIIKKE